MLTLVEFWKRLQDVKCTRIEAVSHSLQETGWKRSGSGTVKIEWKSPSVLLLLEHGVWLDGSEMSFTNSLRWTYHKDRDVLSLEHLHLGPNHPVSLLELEPAGQAELRCRSPFSCGQDQYRASVVWDQTQIALHWRIAGPKKNEEVTHVWTAS